MSRLSPRYSTLKSKEFKEIYDKGEKFVGRFFVIFAIYGANKLKIGFVASKKVGKAHERNRAKRLMREVVRTNQNLLPDDVYLVMIARKTILDADFCDINSAFVNFAKKFLKMKDGA